VWEVFPRTRLGNPNVQLEVFALNSLTRLDQINFIFYFGKLNLVAHEGRLPWIELLVAHFHPSFNSLVTKFSLVEHLVVVNHYKVD
jgi:hypothetical protein